MLRLGSNAQLGWQAGRLGCQKGWEAIGQQARKLKK